MTSIIARRASNSRSILSVRQSLAISTTAFCRFPLTSVSFASNFSNRAMASAAAPANPARIFLGDTGSLAIGAALGTLAVLLKKEILLLIIGGVFVIESLSVILQIYYFRYTKNKYGEGKRIFRMAPLHHHFELIGWPENHVVVRFWIIGIHKGTRAIINCFSRNCHIICVHYSMNKTNSHPVCN